MKSFIYTWLVLTLIASLTLSSCSSPESDGRKSARRLADCVNQYAAKLKKDYESYIKDFDSYSFETRIDARKKLVEIIIKADLELAECEQKTKDYQNKLKSKYLTNREKVEKFNYAYAAHCKARIDATKIEENLDFYKQQAIALIQTIIPPIPDSEKLKKDLIGRRIKEPEDGYFPHWDWEIKFSNEMKEVEILNVSYNDGDDNCLFDLRLRLQGEHNEYDANVNITYVLREYDDWRIDFLESKSRDIIRTGKYDNCISAQRQWSVVNFTNRCDVSLIVGGVALDERTNEWKKFGIVVEAERKASYGGVFSVPVKDYEIHFIERQEKR